jgi:hypothetical protein
VRAITPKATTRCAAIASTWRFTSTAIASTRSPSRGIVRDLQGLRVDDDGRRQGQAACGSRDADPGIPRDGNREDRAGGLVHIGRLSVFAGVRDLPTRVKCAILPWHTLAAALNSVAKTTTEARTTRCMLRSAELELSDAKNRRHRGHAEPEREEVHPAGAVDVGDRALVRERRAGEG